MPTVNETGMIAHWLMDEIVGGIVPDQTGNYPATVSSGMTTQDNIANGRFNNSIFIGDSQKLTVDLPALPEWTVIGWINQISLSKYSHLLSIDGNQDAFAIKFGDSALGGRFYFYKSATGSHVSNLSLPLNQWVHYAATYDGANLSFYLNTIEHTLTNKPGCAMPAGTYVTGANKVGSRTESVPAFQDQRRVYDRALPLAEVIEHYNEQAPYFISGVVKQNGAPQQAKVRLYSAETGGLLQESITGANGGYLFDLFENSEKYVMALLEPGHRPLTHGPITAKQR